MVSSSINPSPFVGETVAVKIHCAISAANIWECRYQMWQDGGEGARAVSPERFL